MRRIEYSKAVPSIKALGLLGMLNAKDRIRKTKALNQDEGLLGMLNAKDRIQKGNN